MISVDLTVIKYKIDRIVRIYPFRGGWRERIIISSPFFHKSMIVFIQKSICVFPINTIHSVDGLVVYGWCLVLENSIVCT